MYWPLAGTGLDRTAATTAVAASNVGFVFISFPFKIASLMRLTRSVARLTSSGAVFRSSSRVRRISEASSVSKGLPGYFTDDDALAISGNS